MNALTVQGPLSAAHTSNAITVPRSAAKLVWLIVPTRWAFAALVFGLVALIARVVGSNDPLTAAGSWWMVSGTLVDLLCLVTVWIATQRERIRILHVMVLRRAVWRDVLPGLALVTALAPAVAMNQLITAYVYGAQLPPQIGLVHLPLWATVYSVAIWPILWAFTEQFLYLGYLFPRLECIGHNALFASAIVILFWSLQHTMLPFVPDGTYLVYRTLTVMPVAITAVVLYLFVTRRRLLPLMIMHMVADMLAALSPLLVIRG